MGASSTTIPLCVPFDKRAEAKAAGAIWNLTEKVWESDTQTLSGDNYSSLSPFLPRMYRRPSKPFYIRPFMIPQSSWGKNLRAVLSVDDWKVVRYDAYAASGRRCIVCGGRGTEHPVEADEAWDYDDKLNVQVLKGVIALCPPCHLVRHWGNATITNRTEIAIEQMMRVNHWTRRQAEDAGEEGKRLWSKRSKREWSVDYSWVTRIYGFVISPEDLNRAQKENVRIIEEARHNR